MGTSYYRLTIFKETISTNFTENPSWSLIFRTVFFLQCVSFYTYYHRGSVHEMYHTEEFIYFVDEYSFNGF